MENFAVDKMVLADLLTRLNMCIRVRKINADTVSEDDVEFGPTVMRVKIRLRPGEKISKLQGCQEDIARELMSDGDIYISNMPGTNCIQIDIPRYDRKTVNFIARSERGE